MPLDFDASDEVQINNRRRSAGRRKAEADEWLRDCFKTVFGRNFFWRLLEQCHAFEISYVQGSFDATAFREGERNVANRLIADITRVAPAQYILMIEEHQRPEPEETKDA